METLTKQKTHTATIRDLDMSIQEEVCIILGITNDFYCEDQYRAYEHFALVCCSESHMRAVRHSRIFRGFWLNEWAQRNQQFIRMVERHNANGNWLKQDGKAYDAYLWFHSTESLVNDAEFMKRFESLVAIIKRKEAANALH